VAGEWSPGLFSSCEQGETVKRDQQILHEITALKKRIKKLSQLIELRGAVNRLESEAINGTSNKRAIRIISETVCREFKLDLARLISPGREQSVALPRQIVFYLARSITLVPFERIGEQFNRDHGTVVHACRSISDRMITQQGFAEVVTRLGNECRQRMNEKDEGVDK